MELDTGFAEEARQIETSFLTMSGRNAVDAAERVKTEYDELETRFRGLAQNERQRGMLTRVLGQRRTRFDGNASTHLVRETETYRSTAAEARIASLGTGLVSMADGPDRLAGIQAMRNEIDAEVARKGLDAEVAEVKFLEAISGVHVATVGALVEAGDPTVAREYIERWGPQIAPDALTRLREGVRKEVDTFEAVTFWDEAPARPAPTVTGEVSGTPVTVTLRPPVAGPAGSGFGPRRSPGGVGSSNHRGVDYPVPMNTPVTASAPGVVRWRDDPDGYGRYAVVDHGNGVETVYAHLARGSVAEGARVEQGDVIGMSGGARGAAGSGNSQGPHVHYEVRQGGTAVNPAGALGRETTVRPGQASLAPEAQPQTLEDVYEQADAAAGDDWRRREVFRAEGVRRFNRERAVRSDAESEAERALQPYLPGGEKEVGSVAEIPRGIIGAVSPATVRAAAVSIQNKAEGEAGLDRASANDTFNHLADLAATDAPAFLALGELTQYRGILTEGQMNTLRGQRRSLATAGGRAEVTSLPSGVSEVVTAYLAEARIDTATVEGAERKAALLQWVMDSANRMETPPDRNGLIGLVRLGLRNISPPDADGNGQRGEARAFEVRGPVRAEEVMSAPQRASAMRSLRDQYGATARITEAQIQARHRRLTFEGR